MIRVAEHLSPDNCPHKPEHLYVWHAYNCITDDTDWLVVVCCCCRKILKGSAEEFERYLMANLA